MIHCCSAECAGTLARRHLQGFVLANSPKQICEFDLPLPAQQQYLSSAAPPRSTQDHLYSGKKKPAEEMAG
jgi:hypothetical protein